MTDETSNVGTMLDQYQERERGKEFTKSEKRGEQKQTNIPS
jgi:hypothetical protein